MMLNPPCLCTAGLFKFRFIAPSGGQFKSSSSSPEHKMQKWFVVPDANLSEDILISGQWALFLIKNTVSSSLSPVSRPLCRGLADTKQTGKLTREQFSLAMYLIQQKATKGIDPPSTLTPDMIPPSERTTASAAAPVSPQLQPTATAPLHLSPSLFTEILPIFQIFFFFHLHMYLQSLMFCCYFMHFKRRVLLSVFPASRFLVFLFSAFCFFELSSILSDRAMRGLCQLGDLNSLHLLTCAEWVLELCVTRWRFCSVIFCHTPSPVWSTRCINRTMYCITLY